MQRLLTLQEAAAAAAISVRTLRRVLRERRLPHYRVGRLVRIGEADFSAWLRSLHVPAGN